MRNRQTLSHCGWSNIVYGSGYWCTHRNTTGVGLSECRRYILSLSSRRQWSHVRLWLITAVEAVHNIVLLNLQAVKHDRIRIKKLLTSFCVFTWLLTSSCQLFCVNLSLSSRNFICSQHNRRSLWNNIWHSKLLQTMDFCSDGLCTALETLQVICAPGLPLPYFQGLKTPFSVLKDELPIAQDDKCHHLGQIWACL